jgi:hypothetical protein
MASISNTLALSSTIIKARRLFSSQTNCWITLITIVVDFHFLWRDNHTVRTAFKAEKFLSVKYWPRLSFSTNPSRNFSFIFFNFIYLFHKNFKSDSQPNKEFYLLNRILFIGISTLVLQFPFLSI